MSGPKWQARFEWIASRMLLAIAVVLLIALLYLARDKFTHAPITFFALCGVPAVLAILIIPRPKRDSRIARAVARLKRK